mmetsp:Transcript_47415/g.115659  ORF Transcript_47415/g.115659 Transcript_47415/m.115659 type:complete len:278 (-) Transcript_47415:149-982(-)
MAPKPTKSSKSSKKTIPKAPKKKPRSKSNRLSAHPWIESKIVTPARVYCNVLGRYTQLTDFGYALVVRAAEEVLNYIDQELPCDIDYSEYKVWWAATRKNYRRLVSATTLTNLIRDYQILCITQQQEDQVARKIMSQFENIAMLASKNAESRQRTTKSTHEGQEKTLQTQAKLDTTMYSNLGGNAKDLDQTKIAAEQANIAAGHEVKTINTPFNISKEWLVGGAVVLVAIVIGVGRMFSNSTAANASSLTSWLSNKIPAKPDWEAPDLWELKKKVFG